MSREYEIYCIPKGSSKATKMASIKSTGAGKAEKAGRNLALMLGMNFHHIIPKDERSSSPKIFNKPKTKNKI